MPKHQVIQLKLQNLLVNCASIKQEKRKEKEKEKEKDQVTKSSVFPVLWALLRTKKHYTPGYQGFGLGLACCASLHCLGNGSETYQGIGTLQQSLNFHEC